MRRLVIIASVFFSFLLGMAVEARAQEEGVRTVEIAKLSVTHLLFTSDLTYVNVASPAVIRAKVVESSKNILALQAVSQFDFTTTISALEANGTMHTFYVMYNDNPASLLIDTRVSNQKDASQLNAQIRPENEYIQEEDDEALTPKERKKREKERKKAEKAQQSSGEGQSYQLQQTTGVNVTSAETSNFGRSNAPTIEEVMRKKRSIYHVTDKSYGITAECINIYSYSDVLYVIISLSNSTDIGYDAGDAQFTVETKKVTAKTLQSDKPIWIKSSYGKLACAPNSMTKIGYTSPKLTLQKNEVMKVYIYEKDGTRNLFLTLDDKDVNYAVSPFSK